MSSSESVTRWLNQLGSGNEEAANRIWDHVFSRLVSYARRRTRAMPRRAIDEEDVAASAMWSFFQGVEEGRFGQLNSRVELWKLLVTITARKARARVREELAAKRGSGKVRDFSSLAARQTSEYGDPLPFDFDAGDPSPEFFCILVEDCRRLLAQLDERTRQVAIWTLQGRLPSEISAELNCCVRTVERKLERIRGKWSKMGSMDGDAP